MQLSTESKHRETDAAGFIAELERLDRQHVLSNIRPNAGAGLTLGEALREAGESGRVDDFRTAIQNAKAHLNIEEKPIIAVLGGLNAGKSSVVASFLSAAGRRRVPRGVQARCGTHRFVYWVPSSWMRDEGVKQALIDLISRAHGGQSEFLSDDPSRAAEQYRSGRDHLDLIKTPLLADDPALDGEKAVLLDCLDIQTRDDGSESTVETNRRLEFVVRAARLCSAFLLVWNGETIRDRLFHRFVAELRERMPTVRLYLLINKIRPQVGQPDETRNAPTLVQIIKQYNISGCYGAFDFDIGSRDGEPGWKDLTPPKLVDQFQRFVSESGVGDRLPQFFVLDDRGANEPSAVDESRFLDRLPGQLDPAELQRLKVNDHCRELRRLARDNLTLARAWAKDQSERTEAIHAGLLEFCTKQFTSEKGEPLQVPKSEFTNAFATSILRKAPWYLKPSLWIGGKVRNILARVSNAAKRLAKFIQLGLRKGLIARVREKFLRAGIADVQLKDAQDLARNMLSEDWVPENATEECLTKAWAWVTRQFAKHPLDVNSDKLDEMAKSFWESLSPGQKTKKFILELVGTLASIAAFGGAITAAIDGGATLLASYSLVGAATTALPGVSISIAAAIMGGGAVAAFVKGALDLNTLPLLSAFFALACDAFGVPRYIRDQPNKVKFKGIAFELPTTALDEQSAICDLGDCNLWKEEEQSINDYLKAVDDD